MQWSTRRFYVVLGLITVVGLGVRLFYVLHTKWDQNIWGDAFTYHFTANGIADGFGFQSWIPAGFAHPAKYITLNDPGSWTKAIPVGASADNPPLFPLYLAAYSIVGLRSFHDHMIAGVVLGTSSVFAMGLLGRKIVGPRVGLIAALGAAVYANFWANDSVVTSESMGILAAIITILLAYRAWEKPTWQRIALLGAFCGLSALVRSEFVLLLPLLLIPLVVRGLAGRSVKDRIALLALGGAAAVLVMSPWLIRNMTIFDHPEFLSDDAGLSLGATNCNATYHGRLLGWWSPACVIPYHPKGDPSDQDLYWRTRGIDYITSHLDQYPVVLAARLGRMWEIYKPGSPWGPIHGDQKLAFDINEGRSESAARLALGQFYLLAPMAIAGGIILWRRKVTIAPLIVLPILVSFTAMYAFGNTRYRVIAEVAIVVFAAVTADALITRFWPRKGATAEPLPAEETTR